MYIPDVAAPSRLMSSENEHVDKQEPKAMRVGQRQNKFQSYKSH
jgi:hypothetical protein